MCSRLISIGCMYTALKQMAMINDHWITSIHYTHIKSINRYMNIYVPCLMIIDHRITSIDYTYIKSINRYMNIYVPCLMIIAVCLRAVYVKHLVTKNNHVLFQCAYYICLYKCIYIYTYVFQYISFKIISVDIPILLQMHISGTSYRHTYLAPFTDTHIWYLLQIHIPGTFY